ncbi:MMPL family transporter [Liquorilactobacillus capillatus]|uniref:Transport protein n=1 Tax=Liquorilactobacillus capillatus DSM 19910 TaxID=1423731 RepID=A0A0R1M248_9LACO|nr:MMPL family transporter [Liquorilactobacillus capillatus]KRL01753.1 transport protein [Liquorilactobacillus capillatus DSM 19910]
MHERKRVFIIQAVIWLIVMLAAVVLLPNVSNLLREKGQTKLPSTAKSQVAQAIQDNWGRNQGGARQVIVVFNNGDSPLTSKQKNAIEQTISHFKQNKQKYHVKSLTSANDNAATKKQLISKDNSTQLLQLMVGSQQTVAEMNKSITKAAKTSGVKTYVTGSDILNDDFTQETEAGIKKTELITVIFIFIVLMLVFKSPITPLVSLLSVGVSFIISLSIVMNLVDRFDFPLSNFTQVFMVVVLFGIGTDYNILLFDQFKEELSRGGSKVAATQAALKTAGRTILYSGSSVLIGFATLGLAKFSVYRSAVGVAVAVAVLLLVLLTLNPFFMAILGPKLFWPMKTFNGGSSSKLWHGLATRAVRLPLVYLAIVLGVSLPFLLIFNNELNYDTLAELNDSIPAKQGFKVVQNHFSKGTAEPSTLYLKSSHPLNNERDLREIDALTKRLQKIDGVKTVASVTQPGGTPIKKLYVNKQLTSVTGGMRSARNGLNKIGNGLDSASGQIGNANIQQGVEGAKKLAAGTTKLQNGSQQLGNGAGQLANGASALRQGTVTYANGVFTVNNGLNRLNSKTGTLANGVSRLATGATSLNNGLGQLNSKTGQLTAGIGQLANGTGSLFTGTQSLSNGLNTLDSKKDEVAAGTATLNTSVAKLQQGSAQVSSGLQELQSKVNTATATGNTGQIEELKTNLQKLNTAMTALEQSTSTTSLPDLSKLQTTTQALTASSDKVNADAQALQKALSQLVSSSSTNAGFSSTDIAGVITAVNQGAQKNGGQALSSQQTAALTAALNAVSQKIATQKTNAQSGLSTANDSANELKNDLSSLSATGTSLAGELSQLQSLSTQMSKLSDLGTLASNSIQANNASIQALDKLSQAITGMQQIQVALGGTSNQIGLVNGSQQVATGLSQLSSGTNELKDKLGEYTNGVASAATGANKLTNGAASLNNGVSQLSSKTPALVSGIGQLNAGSGQLAAGMTTLQGQIPQLTGAIGALNAGTNKLAASSSQLTNGAAQLASGNQTLAEKQGQLTTGLGTVNAGQQAMSNSLQALVPQMATLQNGLQSASAGTKKINSGVKTANGYLKGLKNSAAADTYYVPEQVLKGKTYNKAIKAYMSADKHAASITIILNENPSSKKAMKKITEIQAQAQKSLQGTPLANATVAAGGETSFINDIQKIASNDFVRTASIMLIGILLALMVITRSILQPFYILGTLLLAYVMSLSITRLISHLFLGQDMLTWNTPFFGFIMLIALGVDYSIFLMMKYREFDNATATPSTRIIRASAVIGAVVLSAALILSGTFAALIPSGVLTLIQVALVVIIGLGILVFAIPVVIPSLIRLTYPLTDRMEKQQIDEDRK